MKPATWRLALCALLAALSLAYIGKGMYLLTIPPKAPNDLNLRWLEVRYFLAGRDPNDAYFASEAGREQWRPLWTARDESALPDIGPTLMGGYPPWAFPINALFYGPGSLAATRWWFAAVNAAGVAILFLLGYRAGRTEGTMIAVTLGLACTAMSAISTALGVGQYGIIISALLVLCSWSLARRPAAAGCWLGLAAAKPTLSGPFGLAFLIPLRPKALATLAGVFLLTGGFAWWWTGASTLEMVVQMLRMGKAFMFDSYGLMNVLHALGVPYVLAEVVVAVGCVAAGAVLTFRWAKAPVLIHFAIASVSARLWSYHHLYDNLVLGFLLVALGRLAFLRPSALRLATFLAVGCSLWAPGQWCDRLPFQIFQMAVWIGGLAVLLAGTPRQVEEPVS